MATTENYNLVLPDPADDVDDEIYRLSNNLVLIDAIMLALAEAIAAKANATHTHPMSVIDGLTAALEGKMSADATFDLDALTDVSGAGTAPSGYVLVKTVAGWVPMSPSAAIGLHQHGVSDIVGLSAAIASQIAALVGSSPATLDTLQEIAAALGNDPNFATTITGLLALKANSADVYTKAQVDAMMAVPVGTIIDVYGNGTTAIPGYIKVVPGLEVTSAYPELRAFGLANGWAVNGSGNPVMPSGDALFKRQWSSGQTRDAGRAFGTVQEDAQQRVEGDTGYGYYNGAGYAPAGAFKNSGSSRTSLQWGTSQNGQTIVFDNSLVARTAAETRPANLTVTWYIKAYSAPIDPAQLVAAQVLNDLSDVRTRATTLENKKGIKSSAKATIGAATSFDFNSIPAEVSRVRLKLNIESISTTVALILKLGTAAAFSSTNYFSGSGQIYAGGAGVSSLITNAIPLTINTLGPFYGHVELTREAPGSNVWFISGGLTCNTSAWLQFLAGRAILTSELTRLQLGTSSGTATFTGSASIEWEF